MTEALPTGLSKSFVCPHCGAFAQQNHHSVYVQRDDLSQELTMRALQDLGGASPRGSTKSLGKALMREEPEPQSLLNAFVTVCGVCEEFALWLNFGQVYPSPTTKVPNQDLPKEAIDLIKEASMVEHISPRSCLTLLRVALEYVLDDQGYTNGTLENKIGRYIDNNQDKTEVGAVMDSIRIFGNTGAHATCTEEAQSLIPALYGVFDILANEIYTRPKMVRSLTDKIPSTKRNSTAPKKD